MTRANTAERQKEIIDTSLKIISYEGIAKLTMRNIARKIGFSEAALYKHFTSKKQVVEKAIDYYFTERLFNERISQNEEFTTALCNIFHHKFSWLEENPMLTSIIFQEEMFKSFPEIRDKFINHRRNLELQILKLIKLNQNDKVVKPNINPELYAVLITGSVRNSVLRWKEEEFDYSLVKQADLLTHEFIKLMVKEDYK